VSNNYPVATNAPHHPPCSEDSRDAVERAYRRTRLGDAGFSLIEVVIALVVLLSATVATASLVSTSVKVNSNSRYKQVATDIASSVLDCAVQQGGAQLLTDLQTTGQWGTPPAPCGGASVREGGVTYSLEQEIGAGAGGCSAPQAGVPNELVVTEFVTWGNGASGSWWTSSSGKVVQETSYAAVPGAALNSSLGNILVQVTDDAANGQANVYVVATFNGTPPATENSTTTTNGCVLFPNVATGSWTITATRGGSLDPNMNTTATWTGNVPAGLTTAAPIKLSQEATITPNYTLTAGNLPTNNANGNSLASSLPLSLYNSKLTTNPYVTSPPAEVYPYTSSSPSYTVVPGSCGTDSAPDGYATDGQPVNVSDTGALNSQTVTVPLTPVAVVADSGGASVAGATVTAQVSSATGTVPDPACSNSNPMPTLNLGTTCTGGTCLVNYVHPNSSKQSDVGQALLLSFTKASGAPTVTNSNRSNPRPAVEASVRAVHAGQSAHPSQTGAAVSPKSKAQPVRAEAVRARPSVTKSTSRTPREASSSKVAAPSAQPKISPRLTNTTTTLSSSANPSTYGQSVTLTATVSPNNGIGGSVAFSVNGSSIAGCTAQTLSKPGSNWQATCTTSTLPVGSDLIVAAYSGNLLYNPSTTAVTTLVDSSGHANTGTIEGGVTLGAAGPTSLGANGISLDGSTGWVQTANSYSNPENFSVVAWFKSSSANNTIISFTNSQGNGTPSNYDRLLWLDSNGKLVWGTYSGSATQEITSASAYDDGNWHMAVAEIASSGTPGMYLYVDGSLVASKSSYTTAQNYTGYWHLGWGYYGGGWSDSPGSSDFFSGSLSEMAYVPSELTGAQITTLYGETTTSNYSTAMLARSPSAYWAMQDSPGFIQTVNKAATTTTVTSSLNPSVSGQAVTFTATVSPNDGGGSVAFYSNGSSISGCTAQTLANVSGSYQATCTTSSLAAGSDTITATYSGDGDYNASTSTGITQTVKTATTTTLASSANPSTYGQAVTFTATVAPNDGSGTVGFTANGSSISGCTAQTLSKPGSSWQATCTTSTLPVGSITIVATYSGDSAYGGSTSSNFTQTVNAITTTTTLASSANPSVYGQSVTFTATVSPDDGGGSVAFKANGSSITGCTAQSLSLVGGNYQATCTVASLAVGSNTITASYGGDTNYAASTSSNLTQTVNKANTTTTLLTNPSSQLQGLPVTLTANVAPVAPGAGTPTGTVTFYNGATALCSNVALSSGTATCVTSSLPSGNDNLTATYSGDTHFLGSTSSGSSEQINAATAGTPTGLPYGTFKITATSGSKSGWAVVTVANGGIVIDAGTAYLSGVELIIPVS